MPKLLHTFVALSYLGDNYSGSAIQGSQPNTITIESELVKALKAAYLVEQDASLARLRLDRVSRTDKGVSAACALFSFDCWLYGNDIAHYLNEHLPADIRCLSFMRVIPKMKGRYLCSSRVYEYCFPIAMLFNHSFVEAAEALRYKKQRFDEFLKPLPDPGDYAYFVNLVHHCELPLLSLPTDQGEMIRQYNEILRPALNELATRAFIERTVHYHNFAPEDSYYAISATQRKMMQFEFCTTLSGQESEDAEIGEWTLKTGPASEKAKIFAKIAIHGQAFLYNQIRMMIGALCVVAQGLAPPAWLFMALIGKYCYKTEIPVAPAAFLFLRYQRFNGYDTRPEYYLYGKMLSEREDVLAYIETQSAIIRRNIVRCEHDRDVETFQAYIALFAKNNDWYAYARACIEEEYKVKEAIAYNKAEFL